MKDQVRVRRPFVAALGAVAAFFMATLFSPGLARAVDATVTYAQVRTTSIMGTQLGWKDATQTFGSSDEVILFDGSAFASQGGQTGYGGIAIQADNAAANRLFMLNNSGALNLIAEGGGWNQYINFASGSGAYTWYTGSGTVLARLLSTGEHDFGIADASRSLLAGTKALTESAATAVFNMSIASGSGSGGVIDYTVDADDATDFQARSGTVHFSGVNKAGTETCAVYGIDSSFTVNPSQTQDGSGAGTLSSGTLTYAWTSSNSPTNGCQFLLNAVSSLTQTTLKVTGVVRKHSGTGVIAWQ